MVIPNYEVIDNSCAEPITGKVAHIDYFHKTIGYYEEDRIVYVRFADSVLRAIERKVKIQIWFYIRAKDGKKTDDIIAWFTRDEFLKFWKSAKYSHVEIRMIYNGEDRCYSSTTRGGYKGIRSAPSNEVVFKHPERWDVWEREITESQAMIFKNWWDKREARGIKYDYVGACTSIYSLKWAKIQSAYKMYCSQACSQSLAEIGCFEWFLKLSPQEQANILKTSDDPMYIDWNEVDSMDQVYEGMA